jgi:Ca2+-binding EF-hand superfamily protein
MASESLPTALLHDDASPTSKLAQLEMDNNVQDGSNMGWSHDADDDVTLFLPSITNTNGENTRKKGGNANNLYGDDEITLPMTNANDDNNITNDALRVPRSNTRQSSSTRDSVKTPTWQMETVQRNAKERDEKLKKAKESRQNAIIAKQQRKKQALHEVEKAKKIKEYRANILRQFTPRELKELKEAFDLADTDGGGSIDENELAVLVIQLGGKLSHDDILNILKEMDTDGDGKVDFFEYLSFMIKMKTDVNGGRSKTFMNFLENKIQKAEERREQQILEKRLKKQKMMEEADKVRKERMKKAEEKKRERKLEIIKRNEENERKKAVRLKDERTKLAKEIQDRAIQMELKKAMSRKRAFDIAKNKRDHAMATHIQKQKEMELKKNKRERILQQQQLAKQEKAKKLQEERERREKKAELLKKFTKNELHILKKMFEKYNQGNSGHITRKELKEILESLGDTHENNVIDDIIESVKPRKQGALTFQEFLQLSVKLKSGIGGVKTSFLSMSAKQKELATERRKANYEAKNKEIQRLKKKLDKDRDIHIKRVNDLQKQTKEALEKKAAEQEQEKRRHILKMKERERVELLAAERFRKNQEEERIKLLKEKQDAMASSIQKRSRAIENANYSNREPILYQDKASTMLRVAQVYSQNLQHAHDVRAAKEEKQRQENTTMVADLLTLGDNAPQTNAQSKHIVSRSSTSMGYRRPETSQSNYSGLRLAGNGSRHAQRPSTSGNDGYGALHRVNQSRLSSQKAKHSSPGGYNNGYYGPNPGTIYKLKKVGMITSRKEALKRRRNRGLYRKKKHKNKSSALGKQRNKNGNNLGGSFRIDPHVLNRAGTYETEVPNSVIKKRYDIHMGPRPPTRERRPMSRQGTGRGNKFNAILQASPVK